MDEKIFEIVQEIADPTKVSPFTFTSNHRNEIATVVLGVDELERFVTRIKQEALLEAAQEFANAMDGSDVKDEALNEKLWFACEHLCRLVNNLKGEKDE